MLASKGLNNSLNFQNNWQALMCLFVCLWGGSAGRGRKRSWFKETAPTTSCPSFKRWVLVFKTIIFFKGTSNSTKKLATSWCCGRGCSCTAQGGQTSLALCSFSETCSSWDWALHSLPLLPSLAGSLGLFYTVLDFLKRGRDFISAAILDTNVN